MAPREQIEAGLRWIQSRHGSPEAAWRAWLRHSRYRKGGHVIIVRTPLVIKQEFDSGGEGDLTTLGDELGVVERCPKCRALVLAEDLEQHVGDHQ